MVNRQNYLWTKAFLTHLRDVTQLNKDSITRYWFYVRHLLLWADETFLSEIERLRPTFPAYIVAKRESDEAYSQATVRKILQVSRRLLLWAKRTYPNEFRSLSSNWLDTMRPPRVPQANIEHNYVTLDEILQLASLQIDPGDLALRRDQAGAAMLFLSGMRVGALGSLPIAAVDLMQCTIKQWPGLGIRTKNGKAATTYLLPIPDLAQVVENWDGFVRTQLPPTAMWYTPLSSCWGTSSLSTEMSGVYRNVAIGKRLRLLFAAAGLPFKSAHKFRHGHAVWALQHALTMADYKAISQNLMHSDIRTTDGIYAPLIGGEIQHRIAGLSGESDQTAAGGEKLAAYLNHLSKREMSNALRMLAEAITR